VSDYILKLDETEAVHIAQRAKARGYTSMVDYLRALVAAEVEPLPTIGRNSDISMSKRVLPQRCMMR
jgi:hypothetical protein